MQRKGGYPRLWFPDGWSADMEQAVPDERVAEYEAGYRKYGVRVEWLTSPHGRLDNVLPKTLERLTHNQNVRSWVRARDRRNVTPRPPK